jgi:hypothetical protein
MLRSTLVAVAVLLAGCGLTDLLGGDDAPPPPPPANAAVTPVPVAPTQPGLVMVTVSASSNPPGAEVTGGGRPLGVTPLSTQVPVPAPPPGQPAQTFDFVFSKQGFESTTIQAAPVNGVINITAALAPTGGVPTGGDGAGRVLEITGTGGGAIPDRGSASATATVEEDCVIDSVAVIVGGSHSYNRDLVVRLTPPEGGALTLQNQQTRNPFRTYRPRTLEGRQARGEWTLRINDELDEDSGRLRRFALRIECK